MAKFQVKLSSHWHDYDPVEDKILKRAFMAGFPNTKYSLRGNNYECNFQQLYQKNITTGRTRCIRAPHKWKAPPTSIVKPGPTFCVKVPPGGPGAIIKVPHPSIKGQVVAVNVPSTAKIGQAMLVPVPVGIPESITYVEPSASEASAVAAMSPEKQKERKKKWSTGGKAVAGLGGVAVVGGLAVGGAILGEHIAEEGWDATMAELGDMTTTAGETIVDGTEDALDWAGDAAETVGDVILDLF